MTQTSKLILLLATVSILWSCDGNATLKDMDNAELSGKHDACIRKSPISPGRATGCENLRKECERRRDQGNFAC